MKALLFCFLLAAASLSLEAAPSRSAVMLTKVLAEAGKSDSVKDIWSICSKSPLDLLPTVCPEPRSLVVYI